MPPGHVLLTSDWADPAVFLVVSFSHPAVWYNASFSDITPPGCREILLSLSKMLHKPGDI